MDATATATGACPGIIADVTVPLIPYNPWTTTETTIVICTKIITASITS